MDVRECSHLTKNGIDMCYRCSIEVIAQDTILHSIVAFKFEIEVEVCLSYQKISWL